MSGAASAGATARVWTVGSTVSTVDVVVVPEVAVATVVAEMRPVTPSAATWIGMVTVPSAPVTWVPGLVSTARPARSRVTWRPATGRPVTGSVSRSDTDRVLPWGAE